MFVSWSWVMVLYGFGEDSAILSILYREHTLSARHATVNVDLGRLAAGVTVRFLLCRFTFSFSTLTLSSLEVSSLSLSTAHT